MSTDILPKLIDNCIKDIEAGRITEKQVVEYMKSQGQDWHELRKGFENMKKIWSIANE